MYDIFTCVAYSHNLWLVALAALLSVGSSYVGLYLFSRAQKTGGHAKRLWLWIGASATGFGVWATHFVAMLAYESEVMFGYDLDQTLLSLFVVILGTVIAFITAAKRNAKIENMAAGVIFGISVAAMHFVGMNSIILPGDLSFAPISVLMSITFAIIFALPIFHFAKNSSKSYYKHISAFWVVLSVVSLHFTAMSAVEIVPDLVDQETIHVIDKSILAISIAIAATLFLVVGGFSAVYAKKIEDKAQENEKYFKILIEGVKDSAIYMLDTQGCVINWNTGAERMKGYSREEIIGQHISTFYPEEDRDVDAIQGILENVAKDGKYESHGWRLKRDGTRIWANVVIEAIRDEADKLVGYAKVTRDLSDKRIAELRLQKISENLKVAMDHMANAICLFDQDGKLIMHNRRLFDVLSIDEDTILSGVDIIELCEMAGELSEDQITDFRRLEVLKNGNLETEFYNGKILSVTATFAGKDSWVLTLEDVTTRVRSERRIAHLARHDALTGLPNRRQFKDMLERSFINASNKKSRVAVINIDLNRFKDINDTYGHAVGDEILCVLSARMTNILYPNEAIARFGGDEFIAMCEYSDSKDLKDFLARLENVLTESVEIQGNVIISAASMGVSIYPDDASDTDKILSNADMAMYRAKESFEESICFFETAMDEAERLRRRLALDLWVGLKEGQFYLVYQEQRLADEHELSGYEVLLRWNHPTQGLISPAIFIPIAEECGAIRALGDWVLEQSCRELSKMPDVRKIAINISPLQLMNLNFVERLQEIFEDTGIDPCRIELEVTESTIIQDKNRALHLLRRIREMGVTIALDDFGTGYSSLETLRSFPFDKIKLDRSFITDIHENVLSQAFIRAILALGKSLNIPVLAEGVETENQMLVLTEEGCDQFQGYFFGRPVVLEANS